jgi:magnesium transporter
MAVINPPMAIFPRGVIEIWKSRTPWLMFLMLSATFTSMIINNFESALSAYAVLIGFIPMLMDTGGNSGSQTSTAVIRSLSLGDTEPRDVLSVIWKEIRVAVLCGVTLAAVNFVKMLLIDRLLLGNMGVTPIVAFTVSAALVFVIVFAKTVGSALPLAAEKIGLDPAVMSSPLMSTITDAVSLMIYFTLATLILHI